MTESNLIADGSLAGFIAGEKLHSLMALVLQQFHFKTIWKTTSLTVQESVIEYLTGFMQNQVISPQKHIISFSPMMNIHRTL